MSDVIKMDMDVELKACNSPHDVTRETRAAVDEDPATYQWWKLLSDVSARARSDTSFDWATGRKSITSEEWFAHRRVEDMTSETSDMEVEVLSWRDSKLAWAKGIVITDLTRGTRYRHRDFLRMIAMRTDRSSGKGQATARPDVTTKGHDEDQLCGTSSSES